MKIREIYDFIVKKGLEKDPRSKKQIRDEMNKIRREYKKLGPEDKKAFDAERLKHPFADTRILHGDPERPIRTIMFGIDISGEELLTAYLMNERGAGIDLAMSHHPSGKALANLYNVMSMQKDILKGLGIASNAVESLMAERMEEVSRRFLPINHQRTTDIAKLLDIPFMCVHTPADNHVTYFLNKLFNRKKPKKVKDVLKILKSIPEYQDAMCHSAGPRLIAGKEKNDAGKIFVDMTGGTEGPKKIFARLSQAGVNTIIGMHMGEEHLKAAKAEFLNVIIAGHISSDALGANLVLDELMKRHNLNIIPCSGFRRVKR